MKVAKAQFTGKNWKTNEDTWGDLDTWERRDHELIRGYLNDAPVRFGERELKAGMNNSKMTGSGESIWKDSWIAPDGWKEFSQSKTIMRGWHQARTMNLEENGARFKRNSSSVFKCWEWRQGTPAKLLRYSGMMTSEEVEPTMKWFEIDLGKGMWLMRIHSYVKLGKEFGNGSRKIRRVR